MLWWFVRDRPQSSPTRPYIPAHRIRASQAGQCLVTCAQDLQDRARRDMRTVLCHSYVRPEFMLDTLVRCALAARVIRDERRPHQKRSHIYIKCARNRRRSMALHLRERARSSIAYRTWWWWWCGGSSVGLGRMIFRARMSKCDIIDIKRWLGKFHRYSAWILNSRLFMHGLGFARPISPRGPRVFCMVCIIKDGNRRGIGCAHDDRALGHRATPRTSETRYLLTGMQMPIYVYILVWCWNYNISQMALHVVSRPMTKLHTTSASIALQCITWSAKTIFFFYARRLFIVTPQTCHIRDRDLYELQIVNSKRNFFINKNMSTMLVAILLYIPIYYYIYTRNNANAPHRPHTILNDDRLLQPPFKYHHRTHKLTNQIRVSAGHISACDRRSAMSHIYVFQCSSKLTSVRVMCVHCSVSALAKGASHLLKT